ncbi:MAG: DUF5312 family protein [Spirochaetia bacterium]
MAGNNSVFDKLVTNISREERTEMLERIHSTSRLSEEPLFPEEEEQPISLEETYSNLGFFYKIYLFFKALFSGKDRLELIKELVLNNITKKVQTQYPHLLEDQKHKMFTGKMYDELSELKTGAEFFHPILDKALGAQKPQFFAYLAGLEMMIVQDQLLNETDPYQVIDMTSEETDKGIRREIESKLDDILYDITPDQKKTMYSHARSLHCLQSLASFPFDAILESFIKREKIGLSCKMEEIESQLLQLTDILYSMKSPPGLNLIETLLLFVLQDRIGEQDFSIEEQVSAKVHIAEDMLSKIRSFNRRIPLIDLMKIVTEDIDYFPTVISGGEDWFALFKQFWEERIEKKLNRFLNERKQARLLQRVYEYLSVFELPDLKQYKNSAEEQDIKVRFDNSLKFMLAFYHRKFIPVMNRDLKSILIDGEFYKNENRIEFTDAYNSLLRIPEYIEQIDHRLSSKGEEGRQIQQTKQEMVSGPIRRKKVQTIVSIVDKEAGSVISKVLKDMVMMGNVLDGILHGEMGGKYDSLSNIGYIGGKNNAAFMKSLKKIVRELEQGLEILQEMYDIESTKK